MARVLVVEPDRQIRRFIAGILADLGHHVQQCGDAAAARRWLRRLPFDVLATDLALDANAEEFATSARRLPVLTLSGRRVEPTTDRYERPPPLNDKPFRFADLHLLVAAVARSEPAYSPAA